MEADNYDEGGTESSTDEGKLIRNVEHNLYTCVERGVNYTVITVCRTSVS